MSLLNRGTETVTVYPEEVVSDADGNTITRASATGVVLKAAVQPFATVMNVETENGGFETTSKYRLRLVNYPDLLGAQSQVEWNGKRYSIDGDAKVYSGSRRTAHVEYVIVRA